MYNCCNCGNTIGPRIPQNKLVVELKSDGNIAKEIPVCQECKDALCDFTPLRRAK